MKIKTNLFYFLAATFLSISCSHSIKDDDKTKCIYSSAFEGGMGGIDLFEVKEDNTFRYYSVAFLGEPKNIEGRWYYKDDTVILHKYRDSTTTYGKIFLNLIPSLILV